MARNCCSFRSAKLGGVDAGRGFPEVMGVFYARRRGIVNYTGSEGRLWAWGSEIGEEFTCSA